MRRTVVPDVNEGAESHVDADGPSGDGDESNVDADGSSDETDGSDGGGDGAAGSERVRADGAGPGGTPRDENHVVTAFLRNRGEILLRRRREAVDGAGDVGSETDSGAWDGVSGVAEGDPDGRVRRVIDEETGLEAAATLVRSGGPVRVTDADLEPDDERPEPRDEWIIHPYLFDCDGREATAGEARDAHEWVPATAILESDRETVPGLWAAYERVAPTVRSVAADDEHGASWLSIRALEVLRDRAGVLVRERDPDGGDPEAEWDELTELARRLIEARPSMAVLRNRIDQAMAEATDADEGNVEPGDGNVGPGEGADGSGEDDDRAPRETAHEAGAPAVLESAAERVAEGADADAAAAANASEYADGRPMTLSRSGTVLEALRRGDPSRVFVAESRPNREGVGVAESLAAEGGAVTLHTDAAAAHVLSNEDVDAVLVGADTVLPDGRVVNKAGTRGVAIAAAREGIPVYAACAADKVSTRASVSLEFGDRSAVYDGESGADVLNPTFDVTPADAVAGVITERGTLSTDEVADVAAELRRYGRWREG